MRITKDLLKRKERDLELKSLKMGQESTIKVCGLLNTVPISVHQFYFKYGFGLSGARCADIFF